MGCFGIVESLFPLIATLSHDPIHKKTGLETSLSFKYPYLSKILSKLKLLILLAGVVGVEPTSTVLETAALPLNYTPSQALS